MKTTVEDLKKCFKGIIADDVLAKLDPTQPMVGQGVDSLAITTMAVELQNTYKVTITVEEGVKLKTLNDVVAFLNKA
jgi:acyl carrier protein